MSDDGMVVVYYGHGTQNQIAMRQESALLFHAELPSPFVDLEEQT